MPITINEVVINTSVNESNANNSTNASNNTNAGLSPKDKEALIDECLRRVAELLEDLKDR